MRDNNYRALLGFLLIAAGASVIPQTVPAGTPASVTITPGATPFIARAAFKIRNPEGLTGVTFVVAPKPGAKSRALEAKYDAPYLRGRNLLDAAGNLQVPIFGLYDAYENRVTITCHFAGGPSRVETVAITTASFNDTCGYKTPNVVVPRNDVELSFDYFLVRGNCGGYTPVILDTDGALRWVTPVNLPTLEASFYDNAIYLGHGAKLYRMELDGTMEVLADYSSHGVVGFHHNMDPGKNGSILLEVDIDQVQFESAVFEVDLKGNILQKISFAEIMAGAMAAGGDDPSQFVRPWPEDWFHMNSAVYWPSRNEIVASAREGFVIAVDYDTHAIKWILGDQNKKWHEFRSLRRFALATAPGGVTPIGQHSLSITADDSLLLFNNGRASNFHSPAGEDRAYSVVSKYTIDSSNGMAHESYRYENALALNSQYCSSVYETGGGDSFLVGYSFVVNQPLLPGGGQLADIQGINRHGEKAFEYQYPSNSCDRAYNSLPLPLTGMVFAGSAGAPPTPVPAPESIRLGNISTRALVKGGDQVSIAGFILHKAGTVTIRGIGPSLTKEGVANVILDPSLTVHNAQGQIASNDNFVPEAIPPGLKPADPREAALQLTLPAGAYTAILRNKGDQEGIGLVEVFDTGP